MRRTRQCVGCDLCEAACPSRVISVISSEVPGEPTKRYAREYYMEMTRCLCGMCVDACPVDVMVKASFHLAFLVLAAFLASSRSILGPLVRTAFMAV